MWRGRIPGLRLLRNQQRTHHCSEISDVHGYCDSEWNFNIPRTIGVIDLRLLNLMNGELLDIDVSAFGRRSHDSWISALSDDDDTLPFGVGLR
jgi:hypothetical protein